METKRDKKTTIGKMSNSRLVWGFDARTRVKKNKKGKGSYSRKSAMNKKGRGD